MAKIQHARRASDKTKRLAVADLIGNPRLYLTTVVRCVRDATYLLSFQRYSKRRRFDISTDAVVRVTRRLKGKQRTCVIAPVV
jgi:hypothetical protein